MTQATQWHDGLTEKQRSFVEAFSSNGGNAYAAARAAGYRTPKQQGYENLEKPVISRAIELLRMETTNAAIMSREERQAWWSQIMNDKTKPVMTRLRASELLGRAQGDFVQRIDANAKVGFTNLADALRQITIKREIIE
jgi:phage terminase small subunit